MYFFGLKLNITLLFTVILFFTLWLIPFSNVFADWFGEKEYQRVKVVDPYIELHTGPGRGYPIFYVVKRHDWIDIITVSYTHLTLPTKA